MKKYLRQYLWLVVWLVACEPPAEEPARPRVIKDEKGRIVEGPASTYFPSGRLKAEMFFKDGKLHGRAVKYYEDGKTKRAELQYRAGKLHGVQKRYYKNGALYKEEEYRMGVRDGLVKKYRRDGRLMTEAVYRNGFPGTDLKEYLTNGKRKEKYPVIKVKTIDRLRENGTYTLQFYMSDHSRKVKFFSGRLDQDGFFHDGLKRLPADEKGVLTYTFRMQPGQSVSKEFHLVARMPTRLNNTYLTALSYRLDVTYPAY